MVVSGDGRDAASWAILLAVVVAVLVVVTSTLLTGAISQPVRAAETVAQLFGVVVLIWVFLGGPDHLSAWRKNRADRRTVRKTPALVDEFWGLVQRTSGVFGGAGQTGDSFNMATLNVINEWNLPGSAGPTHTPEESLAGGRAQTVVNSWSRQSSMWNPLYNTLQRLTQGEARKDTYAFSNATFLLYGYLNGAYNQVEAFVYEIRQAGAAKLSSRVTEEWGRFADTANTLRTDCERFGEYCVRYLNLDPGFHFARVRSLKPE